MIGVKSIEAHGEPVADAGEEPLRLRFCPQCDYALESLPPMGRCPECGREYDQKFVIIRGTPGPLTAQAILAGEFTFRSLIVPGIFILFAGWLVIEDPHIFGPYMAILAFIGVGFALLEWMNSPRPGQILVWMSSEGVGQQSDFDPQSLTSKLRLVVPFLTPIVWMACAPHTSVLQVVIFLGILLVVNGIGLKARRMAVRREAACLANGVQPVLFDWRLVQPKISPMRNGRYRLRIHRTRQRKIVRAADIRFAASGEFVEHLKAQMKAWQREREQLGPK
jgi:hypothetical protein